MKNKVMLMIITCFTYSYACAQTFWIENYLDEELVIIFYTNKIFGKANINVEMPRGMVKYWVDSGVYTITGMDIMLGSRRTGRKAYKVQPPISFGSPVSLNGRLRFFNNVAGEMWCEFRFGSKRGQGLLVRH